MSRFVPEWEEKKWMSWQLKEEKYVSFDENEFLQVQDNDRTELSISPCQVKGPIPQEFHACFGDF